MEHLIPFLDFIDSKGKKLYQDLVKKLENQNLELDNDSFIEYGNQELVASVTFISILDEYGVILAFNTLETFLKNYLSYRFSKNDQFLLSREKNIKYSTILSANSFNEIRIILINDFVSKELRNCWQNWETVYKSLLGDDFLLYPTEDTRIRFQGYKELRNCIIHNAGIPEKFQVDIINKLPNFNVQEGKEICLPPNAVKDCWRCVNGIIMNIIQRTAPEIYNDPEFLSG